MKRFTPCKLNKTTNYFLNMGIVKKTKLRRQRIGNGPSPKFYDGGTLINH